MISSLAVIIGMVFWGYALTHMLKIKESFGPVLGIAVSMAVLEIGGAFGVLWQAAKLYCIAVGIFSIAYIVRTRNEAGMKTYFLNPSVIGFLFAALCYMMLTSGATLLTSSLRSELAIERSSIFYTQLDSFLHWGMFSKAVFYNHNLDVWNSDLCVNHRVYPHGMAAWYSLFALGKSSYMERDVMLSMNVFLFAASCPVIDLAVDRVRKLLPSNKMISLIVYLVTGMSVASFWWIWRFAEVWSYTSGYMDIPLGVAFMAALCLVVTDCEDEYRKALGISIVSSTLVMIKPSGIIFVGVVCMFYLVYTRGRSSFSMTAKSTGRLCVWGGVLLVSLPLLELGIWNGMMKYLGITGGDQFRLKSFLPGQVIARYQSDAAYAELLHTVVHNFFAAFFTRAVVLHMSAFCWMLVCIVLAVWTVLFLKDDREKKRVLYANICMTLFFCLYNLFLLWTYLTTMSEGEAVGIVCYDRYIGSYIIGWFVLCIYFLFLYDIGSLKVRYLYDCVFFLCIILGFFDQNNYLPEVDPEIREMYELSSNIQESFSNIIQDVDDGDMPDLWISYANKEEALDQNQIIQLQYYFFPAFDLSSVYGIQEDYQRQMKDIIAEFSFDYVVLYGVNEAFYNSYYWFFADGLSNAREQYENGHYQIYKVIKDETTDEFCWFEPI
ncbi:MAG: hypothetical protein NC416_19805 [Eubacterium sp.]|nr:hypothetical protein [Eubacterium sp.]